MAGVWPNGRKGLLKTSSCFALLASFYNQRMKFFLFFWQSKTRAGTTWRGYVDGKQQHLCLCFILCKATVSHNQLAAVSGFSNSAELRWDRKRLKLKDELLCCCRVHLRLKLPRVQITSLSRINIFKTSFEH